MAEPAISREEALSEAYSRGILPPDMKAAYEEASSRGLIGNSSNSNKVEDPNIIKGNATDFTVSNSGEPPIKLDNAGLGYDTAQRTPLENLGRGALYGLERTGQGIAQLAGSGLNKAGMISDEAMQDYNKKAQARMDYYDKGNLGQSTMATVGRIGGELAPFGAAGYAARAVPHVGAILNGGGEGAGLLARLGLGATGGAAIGGAQFVPEGGSRETNTAIGGLLGGVGSSVIPAIGSGLSYVGGKAWDLGKKLIGYMPESQVAKGVLGGALPNEIDQTLENVAAGKRLGLQLTPAEASDNPILAARQGNIGQSDETAQKMLQFGRGQEQAQQNAVDSFFQKVSPNTGNAAADARAAAQQAIKEEQASLMNQAKPLYQQAETQVVPPEVHDQLMGDTIISRAMGRVQNDPIYKDEIAGFAPNQIKVLDYVKKELDDQIATADPNKQRLLLQAKEKLTNALDAVSPEYKSARAIYEEGMPNLKSLQTGDVGRIANLSDAGLQNLSKIIFDPAEMDINALKKVKDVITSQNPDLWRQIVRNAMESKLDVSSQAATGKIGSAFYKGMMSNDRTFNQFLTALEGTPGAQETFIDMQSAFKNLINTQSVKGSAGRAANSMDMPRSTGQFAMDTFKEMTGGKFDKAAVDMITSDRWLPYIREVKQIKNPQQRAQGYMQLLSRVAAQQSASPSTDNTRSSQ